MTQVKSIFIVEDELISAYDLSDSLQELGYTVAGIFDTGQAAIEQVRENPPDLILMDIKLRGEMDGIEAAAQLQEFNIPVIYLTAFSDDTTLKQAALTCPYGYLTKPAKLGDIRTTIAIALSKHQEDSRVKTLLAEEKRLNALKTRFLATVIHDLRIPLTTIATSLELLSRYQQKLTKAKQSKHWERIQIVIQQMTQQIEELLTVTQAESGKLSFNAEPMDLAAFCQELLENLKASTPEEYQLSFHSQGKNTSASLDPQLLRYILNNLLSNAIKYSPQGGTVSFTLSFESDQVIFCIQDQGIGIPPECLESLFQPFERATNVGSIKGTGIGLYIVKQAVERHQGNISVESEVGIGTKFLITLPLITTLGE